jgi:hypothetical protein
VVPTKHSIVEAATARRSQASARCAERAIASLNSAASKMATAAAYGT